MDPSFRFGVATADHQVEAYDGRDDIWDVWERVRGLTQRGRGTDFWNRYREDVDLAKGLGCTIFRISLSWARLESEPGVWDEPAFEHYRDLLQYLRDSGMQTVVSLHHNVWPLHIQAAGNGAGMLDVHFPQRFEAYATQVARRLGDLIDYLVTFNEPNQLLFGYFKGFWMRGYSMPPGLEPFASPAEQMQAVLTFIPNLFRAHALARTAFKRERASAMVGSNPNIFGLPRWMRRLVDRNVTKLRSPEDALKQAEMVAQPTLLEGGDVDISIAQLTMTQSRMDDVLFSDSYFSAHPSALHRADVPAPKSFRGWGGRVGVVAGGPTAEHARARFVSADLQYFLSLEDAVTTLRAGKLDIVASDDALLAPFADAEFVVSRINGAIDHYAVATGLGNRSLLDAINRVIRAHNHGHALAADPALQQIRKRGELRVGIHPGVPGLCVDEGNDSYSGAEIDLAHKIADSILGPHSKVRFVPLTGHRRVHAVRSWLRRADGLRTSLALLGTLFGTNWWNLGMAGKLPEFLCPKDCVGALDFIGLDYYWGVPSIWPKELRRLAAASEFRYANAPVWPGGLSNAIDDAREHFPGMPIVIVENGSVADADGYTRAQYLEAHVLEVVSAVEKGAPVVAYLCWSITTNREWGLPLDENSDFGLYHVDLDNDPGLKRVPTPAAEHYRAIIAKYSAKI